MEQTFSDLERDLRMNPDQRIVISQSPETVAFYFNFWTNTGDPLEFFLPFHGESENWLLRLDPVMERIVRGLAAIRGVHNIKVWRHHIFLNFSRAFKHEEIEHWALAMIVGNLQSVNPDVNIRVFGPNEDVENNEGHPWFPGMHGKNLMEVPECAEDVSIKPMSFWQRFWQKLRNDIEYFLASFKHHTAKKEANQIVERHYLGDLDPTFLLPTDDEARRRQEHEEAKKQRR